MIVLFLFFERMNVCCCFFLYGNINMLIDIEYLLTMYHVCFPLEIMWNDHH